jgi:hypothetical protein
MLRPHAQPHHLHAPERHHLCRLLGRGRLVAAFAAAVIEKSA